MRMLLVVLYIACATSTSMPKVMFICLVSVHQSECDPQCYKRCFISLPDSLASLCVCHLVLHTKTLVCDQLSWKWCDFSGGLNHSTLPGIQYVVFTLMVVGSIQFVQLRLVLCLCPSVQLSNHASCQYRTLIFSVLGCDLLGSVYFGRRFRSF